MASNQENKGLSRLSQDLSNLDVLEEGEVVSYYQEMLVLVAYDDMQGVDIDAEYPTFCQHLKTNRILKRAFEDVKGLLGAERPESPAPAPKLSFLPTMPRVSQSATGRWEAFWSLTKEYLAEQFNPTKPAFSPSFATRDAPQAADDDTTTILNQPYKIGGRELQVWLKVVATLDRDSLVFIPHVTIYDTAEQTIPENLNIQLEWGAYQRSEGVPASGLVTLPAIDESVVFDTSDQVTAGLQLTLNYT